MEVLVHLYDVDIYHDVNVYRCKDGRYRAYIRSQKRVVSYPKLIMSVHLGRDIEDNEQVHHIDGDISNNSIDTLVVLNEKDHQALHANLQSKDRLFHDTIMTCPICGKEFMWTRRQQKQRYRNANRPENKNRIYHGPVCSKKCAGTLGKQIQLSKHK